MVKKCLITIVALTLVMKLAAQELPQTLVTDVRSGKKIAFNETIEKGKVTLVSFWGTWCAHGKREIKTISHNLPNWNKQADFNFIAIASDQLHTEDLVKPYVAAQGWKFPCYIDANADLKPLLNFMALPYTIIINQSGKIVFTHTGYDDGRLILSKLKEFAPKVSK